MIKAIETRYAGCRFRSRLEARWAVFFDALKIEWQYEPEGFELPSGRYLPDFYLPKSGAWIEIKGQAPTQNEIRRGLELAHFLAVRDEKFRMLSGDVPREPTKWGSITCLPSLSAMTDFMPVYWEGKVNMTIFDPPEQGRYLVMRAPSGKLIYPTYAMMAGVPPEHWMLKEGPWTILGFSFEEIAEALTRARSARFEHGERG